MRIFQNSVSFERPLAFSRVSCVPQETLRNVRKFKVAFSKVGGLLKKPHIKNSVGLANGSSFKMRTHFERAFA
jgi:hypothetical protein